jgi:hypothetical protein
MMNRARRVDFIQSLDTDKLLRRKDAVKMRRTANGLRTMAIWLAAHVSRMSHIRQKSALGEFD